MKDREPTLTRAQEIPLLLFLGGILASGIDAFTPAQVLDGYVIFILGATTAITGYQVWQELTPDEDNSS